jgi:hypothetical protein
MTEYELYEFELAEDFDPLYDLVGWGDLAALGECMSWEDALDYAIENDW